MTAAIILAAGAATRMGRPKQLLPYRGRTLLEHVIAQATEAGLSPIMVVTGAEAESVRALAEASGVQVVHNPNWATGMGSSVSTGIKPLDEAVSAVGILLVDQPLVTASHLRAMGRALEDEGCDIVAAQFSRSLGPPAFFRQQVFPALISLPPEAGAKRLFSDARFKVLPFPLPEAACDVDTPDDFARITSVEAAEAADPFHR